MKDKIKDYCLDIWTNKLKRFTLFAYIITPFILELIIEMLSRSSVIAGFRFMFRSPYCFLTNVLIIFMTLSITLLMRRRIFGLTLGSAIWLILGFTNYIILSNRVTPFTAADFLLMDDALGVVNKYLNFFGGAFIAILLVLVVFGLTFMWIKVPRYSAKINYLRNVVLILIIGCITFGGINIGLATGSLSVEVPNLTIAFDTYGFPYCFSNSLVNTGVKKPDDYSYKTVEEIANKLNAVTDKEIDDADGMPNIIFLQLESFFDITKDSAIQFSSDPIPTFNQLKKDFPSGFLNVHNVGYGTANTEFEVITGMNLDDFGPGEFPFKTILKATTCESMAYNLKENGYATHAMHNNTGTFYSRNKIFSQLGFDSYTSIEYMHVTEFTPMNWAKDKCLTSEITKVLKSTDEPDYLYAISVQGHGSYPSTDMIENPAITVSGIDNEELRSQTEYYANEIYEMDEFIKELIAALEDCGEDTILVMYGDHLPSLGINESDLSNKSLYQTEYVIWNNMDLNMTDEDIETYQLSSKIMEILGLNTGTINKFHQVFKNDDEYLRALQMLEFDILYGSKYVYSGNNPYIASDLQMGTYPTEITEIVPYKDIAAQLPLPNPELEGQTDEADNMESVTTDIDGFMIIKGKNFTTYSKVFVNGDKMATDYIDENTLKVYYPDIRGLDSFVVKQMYKNTALSSTKEYLYYVYEEETTTSSETQTGETRTVQP